MTVNISQLSLPQLDHIKNQLEEDVSFLTTSMQQLKAVQGKFRDSKRALAAIVPENEGKAMLVPLTGSLYVPGKLKSVHKVLVDIGTGYFVERSTMEAVDFYKRKLDYVTSNLEKLQVALVEKAKMREAVVSVMQMRLQAQQTSRP